MEINKIIATEIANAGGVPLVKLGLRFDKVAVSLLGDISSAIEQTVPAAMTVILTITAPIKLPAKTTGELIKKLKEKDKPNHQAFTLFENKIHLRTVSSKRAVKFVGLVHNPGIDPVFLLDLTQQWLRVY